MLPILSYHVVSSFPLRFSHLHLTKPKRCHFQSSFWEIKSSCTLHIFKKFTTYHILLTSQQNGKRKKYVCSSMCFASPTFGDDDRRPSLLHAAPNN